MSKNRWYVLAWIAISQLFALSLWFSASVIIPELRSVWNLTSYTEVFISSAVPIGFIIGTLFSAYFGLADRFNPRIFFAIAAVLGALINGLMIFTSSAFVGILLRLLTGATLAGVYPIAVKILAEWFPKNRGLALGILIAALTLGSALPHFIVVLFIGIQWQLIIIISSLLAFSAAIIMYYIVPNTPITSKKSLFSFQLLKKVIRNKPVMLANYGYFGHMWELYAMWTWLPFFLAASFDAFSADISPWMSAVGSFLAIGVAGAVGCVGGGYFADKIGRARLTIIAMLMSAFCALLIGFTFGKEIWLTLLIAMIWGVFVIADSAQFSAAVSDFADAEYVGTALTFQMCIGFAVTIITIQLIPIFQAYIGWEWVFALLSIGPIVGIIFMLKLRPFEENKQGS